MFKKMLKIIAHFFISALIIGSFVSCKSTSIDKASSKTTETIRESTPPYGYNNKTELMYYAETNNVAKCKQIIDGGADIYAKDNDGFDALCYAAKTNAVDTAKLLIESYADVNSGAFDVAVENNSVAVAEMLIDSKVTIQLPVYYGGGGLASYSLRYREKNPFVFAAENNFMDMIKMFCNKVEGFSANSYCFQAAAVNKNYDMTKFLLADLKDKNPSVVKKMADDALYCCIDGNSVDSYEIVKLLVEHGANPTFHDNVSRYGTFKHLQYAMRNAWMNTAKALIDCGADPNATAGYLGTAYEEYRAPLVFAIFYKDIDMVRRLIKAGADVNLPVRNTYNKYNTYQHEFRDYDNDRLENAPPPYKEIGLNSYKEISNSISRVDVIIGYVPLFYAIALNEISAVQLLLENGADLVINKYDNKTVTAMDIARTLGRNEIMRLLIQEEQKRNR